jgi:hypothetical protein
MSINWHTVMGAVVLVSCFIIDTSFYNKMRKKKVPPLAMLPTDL